MSCEFRSWPDFRPQCGAGLGRHSRLHFRNLARLCRWRWRFGARRLWRVHAGRCWAGIFGGGIMRLAAYWTAVCDDRNRNGGRYGHCGNDRSGTRRMVNENRTRQIRTALASSMGPRSSSRCSCTCRDIAPATLIACVLIAITLASGQRPGAVIKLALMWWLWTAVCLCDLLALHLIEASPLQTFLAFLFTGILTDYRAPRGHRREEGCRRGSGQGRTGGRGRAGVRPRLRRVRARRVRRRGSRRRGGSRRRDRGTGGRRVD